MKLTVLIDNNTLIDRYFSAEPGLSLLIEDRDTKVLFDTGYSDLFIRNALKMGKDLSALDYLVISHSHLDHTWGLDPFLRYLTELGIEKQPHKRPTLVGHPEVFTSAGMETFPEFGSLMSRKKTARHLALNLSREPVKLSDRLTFLGEIPRENGFEGKTAFGKKEGSCRPDLVMDDSALAYASEQGLVIITGCAHAGICNTIAYARKVCSETRVADVIGGFHLMNPAEEQLRGTLDFFKALSPGSVHACHCTDLDSKIALSRVANIKEVGVGLSLTYDEVSG
ncbi:MAG: MBL fold metallo-hydrolase [Desulfobacterales bacterium]|nr:MBL fold metallo-hydrolase [Desulfobacterales bacterium]